MIFRIENETVGGMTRTTARIAVLEQSAIASMVHQTMGRRGSKQ